MYKICLKCKKEKSIDEFSKDKHKKDGHRLSCKICDSQRSKEYYKNHSSSISSKRKNKRIVNPTVREKARLYYKNNREKILQNRQKYISENKEFFFRYNREYRHKFPKRTLIGHARKRAKLLGLPFSITENDFDIPNKCPIFDVPLVIGSQKVGPWSITLDRIIPERGYIKDNIIVVSHRANTIKNNASIEELRLLISNLQKLLEFKNLSWRETMTVLGLQTQTVPKQKLHCIKYGSKKRARDKNLDWSISHNDLIIPNICPLLAIPIVFNNKKLNFNSITIDRLIPVLGYIPNNIAIISHKANTIKNDASVNELVKIYNYYKQIISKS